MTGLWKAKREALISWLLLLCLLALPFLVLAGFAGKKMTEYQREFQRDGRVLQELRGIDAVQDEIRKLRQNYQERSLQDWAYTEHSLDDVRLDVQRKVTGWLNSVQTQRVSPVTPREADTGYAAVGVQVHFIADLDELLDIIQQIENSKPLLVIDHLRITPQIIRATNKNPYPPQKVSVQMTVQTYVAIEGEL